MKDKGNGFWSVFCQAGCDESTILGALGLSVADMLIEPHRDESHRNGSPRKTRPVQNGKKEPEPKNVAPRFSPPSYVPEDLRGWPEEASYRYVDEDGAYLFTKIRFKNPSPAENGEKPKTFRAVIEREDGCRCWSLQSLRGGGEDRFHTLYRLPEVRKAIAADVEIPLCEGEKAVEAFRALKRVATCPPTGASKEGHPLKWSDRYERHLRGARVMIVADRDAAGEHTAKMLAEKLLDICKSVRVVQSRTTGEHHDAADHFAAGYSYEDFVPAPHLEPAQPFKIYTIAELLTLPKKEWLVEGILGRGDLGVVYGQPTTGKTFVTLDLLGAMVAGEDDWANRFPITRPCHVLYCGGEKKGSIPLRLNAVALKHGFEFDHPRFGALLNLPQLFQADSDRSVEHFLRAARRQLGPSVNPDVIVIDTQQLATIGMEENDAGSMGIVIANAYRIIEEFGSAVILLHHPTKLGDSPRGSGAMFASADFVLKIVKEDGQRSMQCDKMGDADDDFKLPFWLVDAHEIATKYVMWNPPSFSEEATVGGSIISEIQRVLMENPGRPMTVKEVRALLTMECPAGTAKTYFNRLRRASETTRVFLCEDKRGSELLYVYQPEQPDLGVIS